MRLFRRAGLVKSLLKPVAVWLGAYGWVMSTSTCPCCGQPTCPVAPLSAGLLASIGTLVTWLIGRRHRHGLKSVHEHGHQAADEAAGQTHARNAPPVGMT